MTNTSPETDHLAAEDIAEDLLYRTGQALVHGRFDDMPDCFVLPHALETPEGVRIVRTAEDIRSVFEAVRRYFSQNDIVDVVRTVVKARFVTPDIIECTHASRLVKTDGSAFRAPYPVFKALHRCDDGAWRIASTCIAVIDSREHSEVLLTWSSGTAQAGA